jgi:hypothetical protein
MTTPLDISAGLCHDYVCGEHVTGEFVELIFVQDNFAKGTIGACKMSSVMTSLVHCHMPQGDLGAAYPSRGSNINVPNVGSVPHGCLKHVFKDMNVCIRSAHHKMYSMNCIQGQGCYRLWVQCMLWAAACSVL